MEGELIFLGFIMLIGQIILLQMYQHNWFKKENFKTDLFNVRATNKLNLKHMEKELGLTSSKRNLPSDSAPSKLSQLSSFLPVLAKLDKDQIHALIDHFIGGGFSEDQEEGEEGGIMEFAEKHPDIVKSFLDGLGSEKTTSEVANY